jgi:hypothetical protein
MVASQEGLSSMKLVISCLNEQFCLPSVHADPISLANALKK